MAGQVGAGVRPGRGAQAGRGPGEHHRAARSPPSGPRSMIQSACATTSRLCSIDDHRVAAVDQPVQDRQQVPESDMCRPVVGSSST